MAIKRILKFSSALMMASCASDRPPKEPMATPANPSAPAPPAASADTLTLVVDTSRPIPIGYGNRWHADVRQIVRGQLAEDAIWISAYRADVYDGHLKRAEQGLEITFRRIAARPPALSGFVAADGTIWEIVAVTK